MRRTRLNIDNPVLHWIPECKLWGYVMRWAKRLLVSCLVLLLVGLHPVGTEAQSPSPDELGAMLTSAITMVQTREHLTVANIVTAVPDSGPPLIVIWGTCDPTVTSGYCSTVYFFSGAQYLTFDKERPFKAEILSMQTAGPGRVSVAYGPPPPETSGVALGRLPDPNPATVIYSWDGTQLVSQRV